MSTASHLLSTAFGALAMAFALVPRSGQAAAVSPDFEKDIRPSSRSTARSAPATAAGK